MEPGGQDLKVGDGLLKLVDGLLQQLGDGAHRTGPCRAASEGQREPDSRCCAPSCRFVMRPPRRSLAAEWCPGRQTRRAEEVPEARPKRGFSLSIRRHGRCTQPPIVLDCRAPSRHGQCSTQPPSRSNGVRTRPGTEQRPAPPAAPSHQPRLPAANPIDELTLDHWSAN